MLLRQGVEVGRVRGGRVEVGDPDLASALLELTGRELPYLCDAPDPGVERTVRSLARPGTPEHQRALMFEVRRLGLEARLGAEE